MGPLRSATLHFADPSASIPRTAGKKVQGLGDILGQLGKAMGQGGARAEEFLANELNSPATVEDLVRGVSTQEEAVQLFTAARIAIDLDTQEEHDFLVALAQGLKLNGELVAHIDSAARAAG